MSALKKKKLLLIFSLSIAWAFLLFPALLRCEPPASLDGAMLSLDNFTVSDEIGKVQERFHGHSSRTIIEIQDVHAHSIAQQNIAAILERLRTVFHVDKAALEGAWTSTALPQSHAIATSREKQLLASVLLDEDRISGPAYASIMSPEPITLVGVEDEALYEKNRALFLEHLAQAKEVGGKLRAYGDSLIEQQRVSWSPELLSFGNAFRHFRETSDLGKFFPLLENTATAQHVSVSDLSQILLMQEILALEKTFEKSRLEQEIKTLLREYKNSPWTIEELIRGGKIPPEKLGSYPELKKMTRLYQLRDQISLQSLMAQIETLMSRVLEKLIHTSEEAALWEKTERFYLAERLLLLEASPADIRAYEKEKNSLEPELDAAGLSKNLSLALAFYETVKKRDEIFFERIMHDPLLAGDIAIVTGGFHTDGLSERFRAAGVSYITVAPDLGKTAMNEKLYESRMAEDEKRSLDLPSSSVRHPSSDAQTLSELRNAIAWIDDRFPESYEVLRQTRDVRKAVKVFLGESVNVSASDRISHLFREGRVVKSSSADTTVHALALKVDEFMAKSRSEQLKVVQGWLTQEQGQEKAMLVSSLGILSRILSESNAEKFLKEAVDRGDMIALAQDIPVTEAPEILSSTRGIDRFEAKDIAALLGKTPRFQRLAKKRPFAVMENGLVGGPYVVLPEKAVSLVLFRIVTLNPSFYQAAKNPAFLALLEDLTSEILSRELPGKSV